MKILQILMLQIFITLLLTFNSYGKESANDFTFGIEFTKAIVSMYEVAPLRLGSFKRIARHNVPVEFFLDQVLTGTGITQVTPTGYYTMDSATSGIGFTVIRGGALAVISINAPVDVDPNPEGVIFWQWYPSATGLQVSLDLNGIYIYRMGAKFRLAANTTVSGEFTKRYTVNVTGG